MLHRRSAVKPYRTSAVEYLFVYERDAPMWLKFNADYVAGIVGGAGLMLFLLALSADADMISADGLKNAGTKFAGLAAILAGAGMKWRTQRHTVR